MMHKIFPYISMRANQVRPRAKLKTNSHPTLLNIQLVSNHSIKAVKIECSTND